MWIHLKDILEMRKEDKLFQDRLNEFCDRVYQAALEGESVCYNVTRLAKWLKEGKDSLDIILKDYECRIYSNSPL